MSRAKGKGGGKKTDIGRQDTMPFGTPVEDVVPQAAEEQPPDPTEGQDDLVTSAQTKDVPFRERAAGSLTLSSNRLSEGTAREILYGAFTRAGLSIRADHQFRHGDTVVILDGFDPDAGIGYQYLSHADADVVTDHDLATEAELKKLSATGEAHVLVIHDVDTPTSDELHARIEEFLRGLGLLRAREDSDEEGE